MIENWSLVFRQSLLELWNGTADFLPKFVIAILILIIGWAFGNIVEKLIAQLMRTMRVDNVLRSASVDGIVTKAGFNLDSGKFVGGLVKWFIIIVFLVASFDVLGLEEVNRFLSQVVLVYLPRVIEAALIILVAALIAEFLQKLVVGAAQAADLKSANFAGVVTKWAVWIFAILTAMFELGIASAFIQTMFTGIIVAVSLAIGLAFGLGGQSTAAHLIEKAREEISHKK